MTIYSEVGDIINTVTRALGDAEDTASSALSSADSFIDQLGAAVAGLNPPEVNATFPDTGVAPSLTTTTPPTLASVAIQSPDAPTEALATFDADAYIPEAFGGVAPALVIGAIPTFNGVIPDAPAVDTAMEVPVFGGVTLPAAPALLELNITPFDGVTVPTFDETVPELDIVEPTIQTYIPGADYASSLLSTLVDSLEDRITNGGTGLSAAVEAALWDREREREAIATRDSLLELDQMEAQGFALPPGQYVDARLKITTEMHARTITLGRDIAVKQAELELENVKHALTLASDTEKALLAAYNDAEQRTFEALKLAVEAGVAVYNAKVQGYLATVDAYKAKIGIFEAQVGGILAEVEAYKATVEAENTKAQSNVARVQAYTALIEGSLASVDVYKAEVSAVVAQAELEKLKTDIYRAQVQGFAATVDAYTGEVQGFKATVDAEGSKQDAFRSQVEAYKSEVQAGAAAAGALADGYQAKVQGYVARWEGYKAEAGAAADKARVIASQNSALIDAYRAEATATGVYNEALTKQWATGVAQAQATAEIGVSAAKANAESYLTVRALATDAAKVGAQVTSQMAAAALNAVNYSLTGSGSASVSQSEDRDKNDNIQTNISL
jgi:hypothetical protein